MIALSVATYSNCTDGDVHLVGGVSQYQGRVEVCLNRAWGTVCAYSSWDSQEAKIVCNQIGALTIGVHFYTCIKHNYYTTTFIKVIHMALLDIWVSHKDMDPFCLDICTAVKQTEIWWNVIRTLSILMLTQDVRVTTMMLLLYVKVMNIVASDLCYHYYL